MSDQSLYVPPSSSGGASIGGAVVGGTDLSVLFIHPAGVLAQDSPHFTFDPVNNYLSVGTTGDTGIYYLNGLPALYTVPNASGRNWFEGGAGNLTLTGFLNFGTGDNCMAALTTGSNNVGLGAQALQQCTTGQKNIALGWATLFATQTDSFNVAIGPGALAQLGRSGAGGGSNQSNIAIGSGALGNAVSTVQNNVVLGPSALNAIGATTNVSENVIIGNAVGAAFGTGADISFNTLIGSHCGANLINGSTNNTWIGTWQGKPSTGQQFSIALSDGTPNTLFDWNITAFATWSMGAGGGLANGLHIYNTQDSFAGTTNYERAILDWRTTSNVFIIGTQAHGTGTARDIWLSPSTNTLSQLNGTSGQSFRVYNTTDGTISPTNYERGVFDWNITSNVLTIGVPASGAGGTGTARDIRLYSAGIPALYRVPNAGGDNWFENGAGNFTLTGDSNFGTGGRTAFSGGALSSLTTGSNNTAMGSSAGARITTGSGNTAVGTQALLNCSTGNDNFALGENALLNITTTNENFAIGSNTLASGTVISGNVAIGSTALFTLGNTATLDSGNVAIGGSTLNLLSTGSNNTGIGATAGLNLATGSSNTLIGFQALLHATSATSNVMIGNSTFQNGTSGDFNVMVGYGTGSNITSGSQNTILGRWYGPSSAISNKIIITDGSNGTAPQLDWKYTTSNVWSFQNLTTASGLHVYNITDSGAPPTNYERLCLDWNLTSNTARIASQAGGTGTVRIIAIDGFSKAGAPANTDLPSGTWALIDDTSGGNTWLVFNKAGTIRKVQLV